MISTAVIGCGYWGINIVRILNQSDETQVYAICDLDTLKLSAISTKYPGVKTVQDYHEIEADPKIDAVVVSTPGSTHYEIVKSLLKSGKHVLCEKPITLSSDEAMDLHKTAESEKRVLMVSHTFLYNDSIRFIKEHISSGRMGAPLYLNFTRTGLGPIRSDVNALWDLTPHDISIMLYLLDKTPLSVTAFGQSYIQKGIEDVVFITIEMEDRIMIQMHISWLNPYKTRELTIVGEKQMVVFDDVSTGEKVKIFDKGVDYQTSTGNFGEFQLALRDGGITIPNIKNREPLKTEIDHFISCIVNSEKPLTDGMNGYDVIRILEAAQKSLDSGNKKISLEL